MPQNGKLSGQLRRVHRLLPLLGDSSLRVVDVVVVNVQEMPTAVRVPECGDIVQRGRPRAASGRRASFVGNFVGLAFQERAPTAEMLACTVLRPSHPSLSPRVASEVAGITAEIS